MSNTTRDDGGEAGESAEGRPPTARAFTLPFAHSIFLRHAMIPQRRLCRAVASMFCESSSAVFFLPAGSGRRQGGARRPQVFSVLAEVVARRRTRLRQQRGSAGVR